MDKHSDGETPTPESVNLKFVEEHLRARWLRFSKGGQPLPHTDAILEAAVKRGLILHRTGRNVLMFDGDRCVGGVMGATPSLNSSFSQLIASSKLLTKGVLNRAGVPTPPASQFAEPDWTHAVAYLSAQGGRSQVVKPADGRQGLGITTGVRSEEDLLHAWPHAMKASSSGQLLIETEVPGVDVRVVVIRGQAEAAATRIPPFVVGNGRHSILELTEQLRTARKRHVYLRGRAVKMDKGYLKRHQLSPRDVLATGEVQFLNGTANLSRGGVSVDLTDTIPVEVMALAETAAGAIPGLSFAGIDILMPDLAAPHSATVIEVNTSPNLLVHDAPAYGRPRAVAERLIQALVDSNTPAEQWAEFTQPTGLSARGRSIVSQMRAIRFPGHGH